MTDKVQKIRNEVERLQNELIQEKEKGFGSDIDDACILELQNVLTYIDSLQEEPVSEKLEEACEQLAENARKRKAETISPFFSPTDYKQGVIDGANWQKVQTGFVRGYRKALEDAWECIGKGFPNDCRIVVKKFFDKEMGQKLKELSQG